MADFREQRPTSRTSLEQGPVTNSAAANTPLLLRKLAFLGTLILVLLLSFPLGEYLVLRSGAHSGVPRTISGLGLDFSAEEWSLSPLSLKATARNVRLRGPSDEKPVLTAGEIEFKASTWTFLQGLPDLVTFHLLGGHPPFTEIIVRHGELHLERSLSGQLNWEDFIARAPQERINEALGGVYPIQLLRFEDFRVTYLENIPGGSGDGIIKTAQAQVKIDEISAAFANLRQPQTAGERPTSFKVQGRSADGVFEISGKAGLFPSRDKPSSVITDSGRREVAFKASESDTTDYPYEMSVYLENIAAAAYGRMVPNATIIPVNGLIGGTVKVVRLTSKPKCDGGFTMKDVRFAPNPNVLSKPAELDVVKRGLTDVAYSGPFELCEKDDSPAAPIANSKPEPPLSMGLTRLTEQATAGASPGIRALVARDRQSLRGEKVETSVSDLTNVVAGELSGRLSRAVSAKLGIPLSQLTSTTSTSPTSSSATANDGGNALTKGVKGVGSGIKRLFGKGKDKGK